MNKNIDFFAQSDNDPKKKLVYGLVALACVLALGFGLDAVSCSRNAANAGGSDEKQEQTADKGSAQGDEGGADSGDKQSDTSSSPDASSTAGVRFEGYDKLVSLTLAQKESFCKAEAAALEKDGYDLNDITVTIKKKPKETDNGTLVFTRIKGTDNCYSGQMVNDVWNVFQLVEKVKGVNDDVSDDKLSQLASSIGMAKSEDDVTRPKKTVAITDTNSIAKYIGDQCASNVFQAWTDFINEKQPGTDLVSALFSYDHINQNEDGSMSFTVYEPSSKTTYRGTANKADGTVSFSE